MGPGDYTHMRPYVASVVLEIICDVFTKEKVCTIIQTVKQITGSPKKKKKRRL